MFSSSSGDTAGPRSHDIGTKSELTKLYNQKVVHAEGVRRPMGNLPMVGPVCHSGTVVTTQDGSRLLVHKVKAIVY